MIEHVFTLAFITQSLRITIPYLLPALGGVFSEKGGVINIALEGILLSGAFATATITYFTGNVPAGILGGMVTGVMIASIHAIATITFKADQIVSGIALNLFAVGITKFFCQIIFLSSSNSERIKGIEEIQIPFISGIPVIGNTFIFICLLILFASQYIISYTRTGLRLRAVGENPEAADTLGINVNRIRYFGVLVSGLFAGLGGSWLALDQHSFTDNMSAGRGFIALAALIIGKWKPYNTAIACFLFGITESFSILMQGTGIPTQFIQMLPYIITIIVLAGLIGKSTPPAADGVPFNKNNDLKGYY